MKPSFDAHSSWGPQADKLVVKAIEDACMSALHSTKGGEDLSLSPTLLHGFGEGAMVVRYVKFPQGGEPESTGAAAIFTESLERGGWQKLEQRDMTIKNPAFQATEAVWHHPQIRNARIKLEVYWWLICAIGYPSRE
jgi:hypothetical protein